MSSFLDPKSSLDFDINRQQPPPPGRDAESLNRRKNNVHGERESSLTTFPRPESTNRWSFQSALLFICITAFLISIYSYDPSHSRRPASQDTFSTVCFPTVSRILIVLVHQSIILTSNLARPLAEQMSSSSLPPDCSHKPSRHRLRHFGLGILHIGLRVPWHSQSGQIPRPNHGFWRRWRVHPVWVLGFSRRERVCVQKCYAGGYYGIPCRKCDDTYFS